MLSLLIRFFDSSAFEFGPRVPVLIFQEYQKALNVDKPLHSKSCFSITTGLIYCSKPESKLLYVFRELCWKDTNFFFCIGVLVFQKCFIPWTHLDFETRFSPKYWLEFFFQCIILIFFSLLLKYSVNNQRFSSKQWKCDGQELSETAVSLEMPR